MSQSTVGDHLANQTDRNRYVDQRRKTGLERRLESLLWGYPELIEEFRKTFTFAVPSAKLLNDELILRSCRRLGKIRLADDEIAEVWRGMQGRKLVALKVLHFSGDIGFGKKIFEVRAIPGGSIFAR